MSYIYNEEEKLLMKIAERIKEVEQFKCPWSFCIYYCKTLKSIQRHRNNTHMEGIEIN